MLDAPLAEVFLVVAHANVQTLVRDDPPFVKRVFVGMAKRDELVVPLEVGEFERGRKPDHLSRRLARPFQPFGDRLEVSVGRDRDITIIRRLKDQRITHIVARQYKRRISKTEVRYYDLIDYDETLTYEEEIVSGKPVDAKVELERRFDAKVVLWGNGDRPKDWTSDKAGAYVDLHKIGGRVERVDQNHVKYFLDLKPGKKRFVTYSVTYKRRKVGPELNGEDRKEPQ